MTDFLMAGDNIPFTTALTIMVVMTFFETVSTLMGAGVSDMMDSLFPDGGIDMDAPEADGFPSLSKALGWLRFGQVPVLVTFVILLTCFGLVGLFLQAAVQSVFGALAPWWGASAVAFVASLPVVRWSVGVVSRIMPRDETEAVDGDSLVGGVALVTIGTAKPGCLAEAKLRDRFGNIHYVMVEPVSGRDIGFGEEVLLTERRGHVYSCIAVNGGDDGK